MALRVSGCAATLLCCACWAAQGAANPELYVGGAGWALQFDGDNDFAHLLEVLPPPPLTIELWVRPLDSSNGQGEKVTSYDRKAVVISRYSSQSGQNLMSILYNGDSIWLKEATFSGVETAEVTPGEGKLYHYAFVAHNASMWTAYINGRPAKSGPLAAGDVAAMSGVLLTAFPWRLGGRMSYDGGQYVMNDRCFGGHLDELRWWSRALSEEELKKWMAVAPRPGEPGLHRRWGFDGAASEAAYLSEGGGDSFRAPSRVPSPIPIIGGPVAIATFDRAPPVVARLCAALVPPVPGATATASFSASAANGTTGSVGPATGAEASVSWGQGLTVELLPQTGTGGAGVAAMLCGEVRFRPAAAGSEAFPFDIQVRLPASAGGGLLSASERLEVSISENLPPTAGLAKAVSTDGRTGYASLGVWSLPTGENEAFTYSLWVKPISEAEDTYILAQHLSKGSNLFLFGYWAGQYNVLVYCRNQCNAGSGATGKAYFPPGPDDAVFPSGKTVRQIKAERKLPHLLTVTFHCHSRGNDDPVGNPARATVQMYVDGDSIGSQDIPACLHSPLLPEEYPEGIDRGYHPTPWELAAEYDGGPADKHAPGVSVVPSNFFQGVFDDLRFWKRKLTAEEVKALASGRSVVAERDEIVRYSFDLDDPSVCTERQLADASTQCFGLNEAKGRTAPSSRYTFTNSLMSDGAGFVNSPFYKVPGSPLHKAMQEGTCATVQLLGSDPNGDALTFSLPPGFVLPGLELLSGGQLRYCAGNLTGGANATEVVVPFDACDPLSLCASAVSGLGSVIFHVRREGPRILHFQVLLENSALRLLFSEPTNAPDVSSKEKLRQLLEINGLPRSTAMLAGGWEPGNTALRIPVVMEYNAATPPLWVQIMEGQVRLAEGKAKLNQSEVIGFLYLLGRVSVRLRASAMLRDAAQTAFPSTDSAISPQVVYCGPSRMLRPGAVGCQGCPMGSFLRPVLGSDVGEYCEPCQKGFFQPQAGQNKCEPCPVNTYADTEGAASCSSCEDVLPGSTTDLKAASDASSCRCPAGTALARASPSAPPSCQKCGQGLSCLGGMRQVAAGGRRLAGKKVAGVLGPGLQHQPPLQEAGFSAGAPAWEGGPPSFLVRCSSKVRCPAGLELGECPPEMERSRACALCREGYYPTGETCSSCSEGDGIPFTVISSILFVVAIAAVGFFGTKPIKIFCSPAASVAVTFTTSLTALQVLGAVGTFDLDWPEPMASLKGVLSLLVLNVNRQRPQCVIGTDSALIAYLGSLAVYPVFMTALTVAMLLGRLRDPRIGRSNLINAHGIAISCMFTSIAVVCVRPLSCASNNPDGSTNVSSFKGVVCWESEEHIVMVIFSILNSLFFVVGYLAAVVWATCTYTRQMARPGATMHMTRFRFLFGPFAADKFYFGVFFNIRKLLIALVPLMATNLPQVQLILVLMVISTNMALQTAMWPWRTTMANVFDTLTSIALILVVAAGFILGDFDVGSRRMIAEKMLFTSLISATTVAVLILCYCAYRLVYRKRQYQFFLSHHKVGAGLLSRWVKIIFHDKGYDRVFLDSDDLLQLDRLINIVAYDCDNIVVLLTRETLSRPWCAMEIVAALTAGTNVVPVRCDGYEGVTDSYLAKLSELWTQEQQATMASGGVKIEDVFKAYTQFRELPEIVLDRSGANLWQHEHMVKEVLARCSGKVTPNLLTKMSKGSLRAMTAIDDIQVAILGDMESAEPACACRVLQHMLQEKMQQGIEILSVDSRVDPIYVLVVLRPGIIKEQWFAEELLEVMEFPALQEVAPLLIGDYFDFPTSSFWEDLHAGHIFTHEDLEEKNINTNMVEHAYRRLFNTLAMRFTGLGSTIIQKSEVLSISNRVKSVLQNGACTMGGLISSQKTLMMRNEGSSKMTFSFSGGMRSVRSAKSNKFKSAIQPKDARTTSEQRASEYLVCPSFSERLGSTAMTSEGVVISPESAHPDEPDIQRVPPSCGSRMAASRRNASISEGKEGEGEREGSRRGGDGGCPDGLAEPVQPARLPAALWLSRNSSAEAVIDDLAP